MVGFVRQPPFWFGPSFIGICTRKVCYNASPSSILFVSRCRQFPGVVVWKQFNAGYSNAIPTVVCSSGGVGSDRLVIYERCSVNTLLKGG